MTSRSKAKSGAKREAEAIARLRADVDELGTTRSRFTAVRLDMVNDLRALLDRAALLDEALDALDELETGPNLSNVDTRGERQVARNQWLLVMRTKARAVLAKAGRR